MRPFDPVSIFAAINDVQHDGVIDFTLEVTEAAKDLLGKKGYDEVYGARPLRREIQNQLEDKLSDDLLRGKFNAGDTIVADVEGEEIVVRSSAAMAVAGEEKKS